MPVGAAKGCKEVVRMLKSYSECRVVWTCEEIHSHMDLVSC